ncbi:unnamed protein product [Echinostoma caproni]|uniref:Fibronectin type-III domain-containing protein n=1 Tax=Echinostoma caproni TaxID=27848 RepID=A0A183BEN2_9TREM|nr:unnamed protein product [Echinostoma caproni]
MSRRIFLLQHLVNQSRISPSVLLPWCSVPVDVTERTKPCSGCDQVLADSFRTVVSLTKCGFPSYSVRTCDRAELSASHTTNRSDKAIQTAIWSHLIELSWAEPIEPNGRIRFYWTRYRLLNVDDQTHNTTGITNPTYTSDWTLTCSRSGRIAEYDSRQGKPRPESDSRASVVLFNLMPGTYEFQVMSVSYAGNSSWSEARQFLVRTISLQIAVDFFTGA